MGAPRSSLFQPHRLTSSVYSRKTRTGRDQTTHDDIFLKTAQEVGPRVDRRFGENLGGFLEGSRRDPAVRAQRCFGDTEEQRLCRAG